MDSAAFAPLLLPHCAKHMPKALAMQVCEGMSATRWVGMRPSDVHMVISKDSQDSNVQPLAGRDALAGCREHGPCCLRPVTQGEQRASAVPVQITGFISCVLEWQRWFRSPGGWTIL